MVSSPFVDSYLAMMLTFVSYWIGPRSGRLVRFNIHFFGLFPFSSKFVNLLPPFVFDQVRTGPMVERS